MMKILKIASLFVLIVFLTACATTQFKAYEGRNNVIEGVGGTKTVVDGMEIWDNGNPPRKFMILGIIDDQRPGGIIPMKMLNSDMVKKAREVGGDALIYIRNQSQIAGYYTTGSATATRYGNTATAYGNSTTMAVQKNFSQYAVIKYVD